MRAAVLDRLGEVPHPGTFQEPTPGDGEAVVEVAAAALHHVERLKTQPGFYLAHEKLPTVVGSDGVGRLSDGRRVYFESVVPPFGAMAERALVDSAVLYDVPDALGDLEAAALGNTGMAAWLALTWRARLEPGETVLVLGAAGALGGIAVQAARVLGAGRVVGADLGAALARIPDAADATVATDAADDLPERLRDACEGGADVIVDSLWGPPAAAALAAAAHGGRLVQLGQLAGVTAEIAAPVLRAAYASVLGFAYIHAPVPERRTAYARLGAAVAAGDIRVALEAVPLERIGEAWERQAAGPDRKLVIQPGG